MPVYIEEINGDVNRPTDQKGESSAICLFESKKIKKRQRFAISHTIVLIVLANVDKQKVFFLHPNFHRPSHSSLNPFEHTFTSNQSLDSLLLTTSRPIWYKFSIQILRGFSFEDYIHVPVPWCKEIHWDAIYQRDELQDYQKHQQFIERSL